MGEGSKGEVWSLVILAPDDPRYGWEEWWRVEDASRVMVQRWEEALV